MSPTLDGRCTQPSNRGAMVLAHQAWGQLPTRWRGEPRPWRSPPDPADVHVAGADRQQIGSADHSPRGRRDRAYANDYNVTHRVSGPFFTVQVLATSAVWSPPAAWLSWSAVSCLMVSGRSASFFEFFFMVFPRLVLRGRCRRAECPAQYAVALVVWKSTAIRQSCSGARAGADDARGSFGRRGGTSQIRTASHPGSTSPSPASRARPTPAAPQSRPGSPSQPSSC